MPTNLTEEGTEGARHHDFIALMKLEAKWFELRGVIKSSELMFGVIFNGFFLSIEPIF